MLLFRAGGKGRLFSLGSTLSCYLFVQVSQKNSKLLFPVKLNIYVNGGPMSQIYVAILSYLSRAFVSVAMFPGFLMFPGLVLFATRLILFMRVVVFVKFWGKSFPVGKAPPLLCQVPRFF
jgi:hypothetical protein